MTGEEDKVGAKGDTTETQDVPEVTPPTTQERTFTQADIEAAIEKARDEELQKYKGIQRTIAQKDKEIASLKKLSESKQSGISLAPYEIMLEEMKTRANELGETNPRITQLETMLNIERRKETELKQREAVEQITQTWRDKLETRIAEANLDPKDERFDDMWESFDITYGVDGKFERVEKKLDRILKGVTKEVKPESKKTEAPIADDIEKKVQARLAEERRKWMEENNLLEKETGQPSGVSRSWEQTQKDYYEGKISDAEYAKRARAKGKL